MEKEKNETFFKILKQKSWHAPAFFITIDLDLEPQSFTLDDYEHPEGFIEEIIRTGIEISEVKN